MENFHFIFDSLCIDGVKEQKVEEYSNIILDANNTNQHTS